MRKRFCYLLLYEDTLCFCEQFLNLKVFLMTPKIKWIAGLAVSAFFLSACSQTQIGIANRQADSDNRAADVAFLKAQIPSYPDTDQESHFVNEAWVGSRGVHLEHGDPLPYEWEAQGVTFVHPAGPVGLTKIAEMVYDTTHIPVLFSPDVRAMLEGDSNEKNKASAAGETSQTVHEREKLNNKLSADLEQMGLSGQDGVSRNGSSINDGQQSIQRGMPLDFKRGRLSDFLKEVCYYYGLTWRYNVDDGGRITIMKNISRLYHINALPVLSTNMKSGLSQELNSAPSSGGGQQTQSGSGKSVASTESEVAIKVWDDVENGIKSILESNGISSDRKNVSVSRSTGTILVNAPVEVMERIQNFIDSQNQMLSKQVSIGIQVYAVNMNNSDALNVNMQAMISKAVQLGSIANPPVAAGMAFLNWSHANSAGESKVMLDELSKYNKVTTVTNSTVTTTNGIPVSLTSTRLRQYVAEVQTMNTGIGAGVSSSNSQTTIQQGSVTYGYNLLFLPLVNPGNNQVSLKLGISRSNLMGSKNGFNEFTVGNMTVQQTDIAANNIQQDLTIQNGHTTWIAGFQQNEADGLSQGTGRPDMLGLGGSASGSQTKEMLVIGITPVVLSSRPITYTDR